MRRLLGSNLGILFALCATAPAEQDPLVTAQAAPAPAPAPARRALLVGIERYPPAVHWPELSGPRADVNAMREVLIGRFGFRAEDIAELLDETATHKGIQAGLDRLVEKSAPGELILFYFAGHGSSLPDDNGDELGGWDDTLVPYDACVGTHRDNDIRDDEIERWIARANKKTDQVALIFDCCSSGTNTRDENPGMSRYLSAFDRTGDCKDDIASRGIDAPRVGTPLPAETKGSGWVQPRGRYVSLSACRDKEAAFELRVGGADGEAHVRGLFTVSLIEELSTIDPDASWSDLMLRVSSRVAARVARQTPVIEGALAGYSLFHAGAPARAPRMEVEVGQDGNVRVHGGLLQGLSPGAVLAVCTLGAPRDDPKQRLGEAKVAEAAAGESLARWQGAHSAAAVPGPYSAFLLENGEGPSPLRVSIEGAPEAVAPLVARLEATHLLRRAEPDEEAHFRIVAREEEGHRSWRVLDRDGRALWGHDVDDTDPGIGRLTSALSTLGRAWRTEQMLPAAGARDLQAEVALQLLGEVQEDGSYSSLGPPERDERGRWRITAGQRWSVSVANHSDVPVYSTLVLVCPDGEVVVPCRPVQDDQLLPGGRPAVCPTLDIQIPEGLEAFYAGEPVRLYCVLTPRWHDLSTLEQGPFALDAVARGAQESGASPLAFETWSTTVLEISVAPAPK